MNMASEITPRPAHLWHLPQLAAVLWAFTRSTSWLPVVRSRWVDLRTLAYVTRLGWVSFVGKSYNVQGFIARDGARIHALYVRPGARGQGRGAVLIRGAQAQSARLELWTEQANQAAQKFYHKHGFVEVARSDGSSNDERIPDIHLVWQKNNASRENLT